MSENDNMSSIKCTTTTTATAINNKIDLFIYPKLFCHLSFGVKGWGCDHDHDHPTPNGYISCWFGCG